MQNKDHTKKMTKFHFNDPKDGGQKLLLEYLDTLIETSHAFQNLNMASQDPSTMGSAMMFGACAFVPQILGAVLRRMREDCRLRAIDECEYAISEYMNALREKVKQGDLDDGE